MRLSVRAKVIGGFLSVLLIGMTMGIYCLYATNKLTVISKEQAEMQKACADISTVLASHFSWRQALTATVFDNAEFTGTYDSENCSLGQWRNSPAAKTTANAEIIAILGQIEEPHHFIHTEAKAIVDMVKEGRAEEAQAEFMDKLLPKANSVITYLNKMTDQYNLMINNHAQMTQDYQRKAFIVTILLMSFVLVTSVTLTYAILKSILNPLRALAKSVDLVASGNFKVNFGYPVNDEIGKLSGSMSTLVDTCRQLIDDMKKMASKHAAGEIDFFSDSDRYNGEFKEVANGVNNMAKIYLEDVQTILGVVKRYGEGDFDAKLVTFPGGKNIANTALDNVSNNLNQVSNSVMTLVKSAMDGKMDTRIDESAFKGGWRDIIAGMNNLLEVISEPMVEALGVLALISEGKLDEKIRGKYNGQFKEITGAINKTVEILSSYIMDISETLNELASDNFNIKINREYAGNFSSIKVSLNAIIDRLNSVMREIGSASEQVTVGAGQISDTSMTLAQGATEQGNSVEQLNESIEEVYVQTLTNAENATNANTLVAHAEKDARLGNEKMTAMVSAMSDINESSKDISKIIKVIEDIAFQTNLLALNAAVEAARAGAHGKGFAVVADEVRNLAAKSQQSAKETAELIEKSITRVNEGTALANETASALEKIVSEVEDVSDIINKIEDASKDQADAISQITKEVGHVATVAQSNAATSEESAAAAEELNSQAELLKIMINRFELKKN